jgi:hypothetical protein
MKKIIDYIESSCKRLGDDRTVYLYKKKLLGQMSARAEEIAAAGLKDEAVLRDLIADEFGDLEAGYADFLADEKRNRRKKMMKIGFPAGGFAFLLLILVTYFIASDATGDWGRTWLIIVGGIFAMIIFYIGFAIRKLCSMRRIFHPVARVLLAGCVMLATVFSFLFFLMMFPAMTTWPIVLAGVILAFVADDVFAFATKQKFRTVSLFVSMPAISALLYVILAAYGFISWGGGWPVILLGVAADAVYIISVIMSNMKYLTYRQEVEE